ncbi:MAG: magnesium transporter [Christensenellales bacterium]|jgi:magnesium transporter
MDDVMKLFETGQWAEFKKQIVDVNAADIAAFLDLLYDEIDEPSRERALRIFRMLPKDLGAEVFAYLDADTQQFIVETASGREIRMLIDDLFIDDVVDFLEEVPANVVKKVLQNTSEDMRKTINHFLNYPENSAGSLMTIEMVELHERFTVHDALNEIRKTGLTKETVYTCYVIDNFRKLTGVVSLKKLIVEREETLVGDIMQTNVISAHTLDDQETVADSFVKYDLMAMPVVDNENRLVGIITIDDIVDVIQDENTEDFEKMAAIRPSDEAYLKTEPVTLAKRRILWLMILMISATITGFIIHKFESVLSNTLMLAIYIPMLMGTGGNAGSQASTMVIRGIALGEVELSDAGRILLKEFKVSLMVGLALSTVCFLKAIVLDGATPLTALVVSLSMYGTVIVAKAVGCLLPLFAKSIKLDPALMASPMISTIVDACSLLIYFSLASSILGIVA